jgi:hypothetical protein
MEGGSWLGMRLLMEGLNHSWVTSQAVEKTYVNGRVQIVMRNLDAVREQIIFSHQLQ